MKNLFEVSVKWDLLFISLCFIFLSAMVVFSFLGIYIPVIETSIRVVGILAIGALFGYIQQISFYLAACESNDESSQFLQTLCIKIGQFLFLALIFELALLMIGAFL